ncbi:MAG: hypothetical protein E7302_14225 [Butyrivibrio sp.]|nr:hypothetical protein [Butyrivibrio sp.]
MKNSSNWLQKEKKQIAITLGIFVYYLLIFIPVLRSGYMYDDIANYTAKGWAIMHDTSMLDMTKYFAFHWIKDAGRSYLFAWYGYAFFSVVGLRLYKFLIVLTSFIDGNLFGCIVGKYTKNNRLRLALVAVFPILVTLNCSFFSSMFGFHLLLQVTFFWSLLGIYFFQRYLETGKIWCQVVSCLALFTALQTYEVSYILCLLYLIIAVTDNDFIRALKKLLPQIVVGIICVGAYIYVVTHASGHYAGTSVAFGPQVIGGFLRQLSSSTSAVNSAICLPLLSENASILFESYSGRYILTSVITIIAIALLVGLNKKSILSGFEDKISNGYGAVAIGLWTLVSPAILIGLSQRYQVEVQWGKGYLPFFVQTWGAALLVALAIVWLDSVVSVKWHLTLVLSVFAIMSLIPNQMVADYYVDAMDNYEYQQNNLFRGAASTGVFDDWNVGELILDGNGSLSQIEQHYAYLLNYKVESYSINDLYNTENETLNYTDAFSRVNDADSFRYVYYVDRTKALIYANASGLDIQESDGNISMGVYSSDIYVFVPKESDYSLVKNANGEVILDLNQTNALYSSSKGNVYELKTDSLIDVRSISVTQP